MIVKWHPSSKKSMGQRTTWLHACAVMHACAQRRRRQRDVVVSTHTSSSTGRRRHGRDVDVRTRGRRLCADEFCYKRLAIGSLPLAQLKLVLTLTISFMTTTSFSVVAPVIIFFLSDATSSSLQEQKKDAYKICNYLYMNLLHL